MSINNKNPLQPTCIVISGQKFCNNSIPVAI